MEMEMEQLKMEQLELWPVEQTGTPPEHVENPWVLSQLESDGE